MEHHINKKHGEDYQYTEVSMAVTGMLTIVENSPEVLSMLTKVGSSLGEKLHLHDQTLCQTCSVVC